MHGVVGAAHGDFRRVGRHGDARDFVAAESIYGRHDPAAAHEVDARYGRNDGEVRIDAHDDTPTG